MRLLVVVVLTIELWLAIASPVVAQNVVDESAVVACLDSRYPLGATHAELELDEFTFRGRTLLCDSLDNADGEWVWEGWFDSDGKYQLDFEYHLIFNGEPGVLAWQDAFFHLPLDEREAMECVEFVERAARASFGDTTSERVILAKAEWQYEFQLDNPRGDQLHFRWEGRMLEVSLTAAVKEDASALEPGLLLLSPGER
ncbi:MAG: hypothetical protein V1826_00370 [bacterium]